MSLRYSLLLAPALLLAACGDPDEPGDINSNIEPGESGALAGAAAMADDEIMVSNGWVRNPAGGRDITAGYVTLQSAEAPARLVLAESPEAERVELHTMAMDGDVMRMRQVEGMDVPAGGTLSLEAGGDHLMIFGLAPDAAVDGELDVVLTFEGGRVVETSLPFADSAPAGG